MLFTLGTEAGIEQMKAVITSLIKIVLDVRPAEHGSSYGLITSANTPQQQQALAQVSNRFQVEDYIGEATL
eukprot:gene6626-333_t